MNTQHQPVKEAYQQVNQRYKLTREEIESKLRSTADTLPDDKKTLGEARSKRTRKITGYSQTPDGEVSKVLRHVAGLIFAEAAMLTGNNDIFGTFNSTAPRPALKALEKIVSQSGFACVIVTHATAYINRKHPDFEVPLRAIEALDAQPCTAEGDIFHISSASLDSEALKKLGRLSKQGLTLVLWPALELR